MTNKEKKHKPKLKKLQGLMISWAEHQVDGKKRDLPKNWEPDFKYLLQLENCFHLTRHEMQKCNEIYKYYGDPKGILRNVR
jgi:hypothetical protein